MFGPGLLAFLAISFASLISTSNASPVTIATTSGQLQGTDEGGVISFKGIRYGLSPTGARRWEAPAAFTSTASQDATKLGPSCIQQFGFSASNLTRTLFNNPPPPEDEDCLFLNVWAPSGSLSDKKAVVIWIHGGGLTFGTASLPFYDGTSIASNQGIVVVTINYRTNVFGFPAAPDLPAQGQNLGLLDQELAFAWVQLNIANFGGDPTKVTIMGQSAGGLSVSTAISRHSESNPPFRAAIILSGNIGMLGSKPKAFNDFASALGCTQDPGPDRIACLKAVPASTISTYVNGPDSGSFGRVTIDDYTVFEHPVKRIVAKKTARVPTYIGSTKDDGSLFAYELGSEATANITGFLKETFGVTVSEAVVKALYPAATDGQKLLANVITDLIFQCPAGLWAGATVTAGVADVYRYIYGPVFPDQQLFPGAGAPHAGELPIIFGTYNKTTATPDEVALSATYQTVIANFVKNPSTPPAPNWSKYAGANVAKLAYEGNVETDNVVQLVKTITVDGSCALWDVVGALVPL